PRSFLDALGMGLGFTCALLVLGSCREILGFGTVFGYRIMWKDFHNWIVMILPAGAFITLGFLVGIFKIIDKRVQERKSKK
ncbi:MAG: Rnf-Nqr domain containing protein, partial [Candidatus Omnitrophota bacterium]